MTDGFALGYNVVFPIIMILLLGTLCKGVYKGEISSFQYYAIVVIPFSTLMGIVTAAYAGKDDAYAKVAQRVMVSPITKEAIVMSKVILMYHRFFDLQFAGVWNHGYCRACSCWHKLIVDHGSFGEHQLFYQFTWHGSRSWNEEFLHG